MDHQSQLEKSKYRNWVKGGLAYKYLKDGIDDFADEIVVEEHKRILKDVKHPSGLNCNQCTLKNLRPLHKCETDSNTGKRTCPWCQVNCNCLFRNKRPCRNNVCDAILEEILKSHGSTQPSLNWKNTDIQKWCSTPWEVAKCFINAPGYSDKTTALDIDAPGLLHVFINSINHQANLACKITGTDVLNRVLKKRNTLFHSPTMELEDKELNELIDDVIEILEDEKKLKANHDAIKAVEKLRQLKEDAFIMTTHDEVEVCRATMASVDKEYEELKQAVEDCKNFIESKESHVKQTAENANVEIDKKIAHTLKSIQDKTEDTKKEIDFKETLTSKSIHDKLEEAKKEIDTNQAHASKYITDKSEEAKKDIDTKQTQVLKSINDETEQAKIELNKQNDSRFRALKQTIDSLKERVRDLEQDSAVIKQRLTEAENRVNQIDVARIAQQKQLGYVNQKQACQRKVLDLYQNNYVKTGISPLKKQDNDININEVYVTPSMTVEQKEKESKTAEGNSSSKNDRVLNRYRDIFRTDGSLPRKIYIVGDVGSGKSSLSKMMLYNWCKAIKSDDETNATPAIEKAPQPPEEFDDINEMRRFNFVFFISLQRMSGHSSSLVEMIRLYYQTIVTSELLDKILAEESEHCLIIADGLDEWTPSKTEFLPEHVSYGIPLTDGLQNATVITLSRPSAKGLLNMKTSEYDKKIKLQGIDERFINEFIKKYMSKQSRNQNFYNRFLHEIRQNNLEHLEKSPLLLQQLVWMYCMGHSIGKTVSEIYSNVVNIMFGWSKNKDNLRNVSETEIKNTNDFQNMRLPVILKRLPRCEANKHYLLKLGEIAFNAFTSEISSHVFGSSSLLNSGLSQNDIDTLTSFGVLAEYNCIDPTYEDVYFSFIHTSYLEFFAAVYISSQNGRTTVLEGLFKKYKRPSDVLQLSNVLKMACGLSTFLLGEISKLISINVTNDESMIRYRKNLHDDKFLPSFPWIRNEAEQIQHLIYNCSRECEIGDQPVVSLCDIVIRHRYDMSFLQKIIPSSVLSLYSYPHHSGIVKIEEILKWAENLPQLQYICINGEGSHPIPCNSVQEVASFVQKVVSVKHLSLVRMVFPCEDHVIDLSKHNQLHSLHLKSCTYRVVSFENLEHLNDIYIDVYICNSSTAQHAVLDQLVSSLTKVVSLKHLTLKSIESFSGYCGSHTIDLSAQAQLHSIHLENCPFQVGSLGNTEHLENVYISGCPLVMSVVLFQMSQPVSYSKALNYMTGRLASSLTQAVGLKRLTLDNIACFYETDESYVIDLSRYDQLESLEIRNILGCLSVINLETAKTMRISRKVFARTQSVSSNGKTQCLEIIGNNWDEYDNLYTITMNSRVHILQQLQSLSLEDVNIDENALTISPTIHNLRNIKLSSVDMSLQTWRTFLDSLCTLKQSVQVELMMRQNNKTVAALENVRQNKNMFEVVSDGYSFKFKTTPKTSIRATSQT